MRQFLLFIFVALLLSACGKYEQGPELSLRSKKARLTGDWIPQSYAYPVDYEGDSINFASISFDDEGKISWNYYENGEFEYLPGTWKFSGKKTHLFITLVRALFTPDKGNTPVEGGEVLPPSFEYIDITWDIIRLTKTELIADHVTRKGNIRVNFEKQ
ncbi:MAG: hypothetical protein KKA07_12715 [Bacteroidetes bacterium]|nr:hypothetical protein [Bacteroidota bacterium]MBU1719920.1 hypothetical protein [Bacteroidota bacterium]